MTEEKMITFRTELREEDIACVRDIILSTDFFYDIEVPVALELVQDALEYGAESDYHVIFAELGGASVAYSCFGPIAGTEGSFDLYWIATHNNYRAKGVGKTLLEETERVIRKMGGRLVIAETSTLEKYKPTRLFYEKMGYLLEAEIRDYYKVGDGKVIYVKRF